MPHTVLIVDDNDAFRGMLCSVLGMRGFVTIPARSGADGLTLASDHRIDAVLADIEMPEMDGFEFARRLAEQNQAMGREVPVWIMTGTLRPGVNRKAASVGAVMMLRKPLNPEETSKTIATEIERRAAAAAAPRADPS